MEILRLFSDPGFLSFSPRKSFKKIFQQRKWLMDSLEMPFQSRDKRKSGVFRQQKKGSFIAL